MTTAREMHDIERGTRKGSNWPQYLAATVVNINSFAYGSMIGWPAFALPQLMSADAPVLASPLTQDEASWLASLMTLGALIATPIYSVMPSFMGRKTLGYLTAIPLLVSWAVILCFDNVEAYYVSKVLAGLSGAGTLILPSIYVSEIATPDIRGALGTLLMIMRCSGILFAYAAGAYLSYWTMVWVNLALPLAFVSTFYWLPETPFYLLSNDRRDEALASLRWFRASDDVKEEIEEVQMFVGGTPKKEGDHSSSFAEILFTKGTFMGLTIVVVLSANQMLSGLFAVLNYAVLIFEEAGSSLPSSLATIMLGVLQLVGSAVSTVLVDRLGRRILLIVSNLSLAVCMGTLGTYFYLKNCTEVDVSNFAWIPVTCLSVFVCMMSVGLGPLVYVLVSETVAPRIRGLASLFAFSTIWFLAFIITKFYPVISAAVGQHGSYWIFSSVCVLGTIFVVTVVPETKGRPLEDILRELNGDKLVKRVITP